MSEKIFACFLRLYPSRFREKYREEATQLYRDLCRDESGPLQRMRLWFRLLTDLVSGLPLAYRNIYVSPAASPVAHEVQGMPTFRLLEPEPVRPGLFLFGSVLTLALLGAFSVVLSHPATYPVWDESSVSSSPIEAVLERLNRATSSTQSGNESPQMDDSVPNQGRTADTRKAETRAAQHGAVAPQKAIDSNPVRPVNPPIENRGTSHSTTDRTASVARLTPEIPRTTRDAQHPGAYHGNPIPSRNGLSALAISPARAAAKPQDCPFERIAVLPQNIGYFKLDSFPDSATCGPSAEEAMSRLNETSAVILDLRGNRGGDPESLQQIAAWLIARPATWYNPRERSAAQSTTLSPARNSRLGNKPVYILTSSLTGNGAEQFAYNLKTLKRATLIGERTRSAAPSKPNGQGNGVTPDVRVKASEALQIAEQSAVATVADRRKNE
jgi:hypothetical protein